MKKVTVLTAADLEDEALAALRELAVLHLEPGPSASGDLQQLRERGQVLQEAIDLLEPDRATGTSAPDEGRDGWESANELLALNRERARLENESGGIRQKAAILRSIGLSDPEDLAGLKARGIDLAVCETSRREWKKWEGVTGVHPLGVDGPVVRFVMLGKHREDLPHFSGLELPPESLPVLERRHEEIEERLAAIRTEVERLQKAGPAIEGAWRDCRNAMAFEEARLAMKHHGEIAVLGGFCPVRRLADLRQAARRQGWGLLIAEPGEEEPVPTLLKNSRVSALLEPLMKFLGIVPGYRECHTHAVFLVFFTIFFAIIIGDAGYGLLMLGVSLWAGRRFRSIPREVIRLSVVLAVATLVWGAVSGMWFGIEGTAGWPVLGALIVPALNAHLAESQTAVIKICFALGLVHLTIAHGWQACRLRSLKSLAEAGWILVVAGIVLIASNLLLEGGFYASIWSCLIGGALLILLFAEQDGKGFVQGVIRGLVTFPINLLTGIGSFSDVVSYIRLFAVGLATREVAVAFNGMAMQQGLDTAPGAIAFALIVIAGHSVNLALAAMGVLVHGVRLNLLEFSRHLGMAWTGIPYRPFRWVDEPRARERLNTLTKTA